MNDTQAVEAIKQPWQEKLKELQKPFGYEVIRDQLNDSKFWFQLPDEPLTAEGYIRILAHLQNLRNDIVRIKMTTDEHSLMKSAAYKTMQKILPGISDAKTDKLKEADSEKELMKLKIVVDQATTLQKLSDNVLNNVDSAIAQLNRQLKAVEMGHRTFSLSTAEVKDWTNEKTGDDNEWETASVDRTNDVDVDE
jgi:predicted  nucleic acid-binding Zn-ribbon protein